MMANFVSTYLGELLIASTHLQSGTKIVTDAPVDNNGKGSAFSPTDLLATSLANCMMTIMGVKAEQLQIDITGAKMEIVKTMAASPRRVQEIKVDIYMPTGDYTDKDKKLLEAAAFTCPVSKSLHPDICQNIIFHW